MDRELTTDDDNFHPPTDDPWWTETVWFAWMVPERKLLGYFYPVFRPNVGVQFGGVLVVDDSAELPWEIPIFEFGWHAQIPVGLDLRDAQLDNGMRIKAIEPARVFEYLQGFAWITVAIPGQCQVVGYLRLIRSKLGDATEHR